MDEKNTKNILVIGNSGNGKSTFINSVYRSNASKDVVLAEEGNDPGKSCTHTIRNYFVNHPVLGPVNLIDTPGFNDTDENYDDDRIMLEIFNTFFDFKRTLQIECILFFNTASPNNKIHYDRIARLFCRVFSTTPDKIKNSVVMMFTKYNDLSKNAQLRTEAFLQRLKEESSIPAVKWDSKTPLVEQFFELKSLIETREKFLFDYGKFSSEIKKIAAKLREEDKEITNTTDQAKLFELKSNNKKEFLHSETTSKAGFLNIATFGISWLLTDSCCDVNSFLLKPDYPVGSANVEITNKKISNIKFTVEKNKIANYVFDIELGRDGSYANCRSKIYFDTFLFGKAYIKYKVTYDYSYDSITVTKTTVYNYKDIEEYMEKATDMFIHEQKKKRIF